MPSVITNGFILPKVEPSPLIKPMKTPLAKTANTPTKTLIPITEEAIAVPKDSTAPTVRSIPATIITMVCPKPTQKRGMLLFRRLFIFLTVPNPGTSSHDDKNRDSEKAARTNTVVSVLSRRL